MTTQGRFEVSSDPSRNCVKLSFIGRIEPAELEPFEGEITRILTLVHSGFTLVTDLTDLASMSLDCAPFIERTMDQMKRNGVKLVVRIIPDPAKDIGMSILSLFHYPRGLKIITTETREEAARVIEQPA